MGSGQNSSTGDQPGQTRETTTATSGTPSVRPLPPGLSALKLTSRTQRSRPDARRRLVFEALGQRRVLAVITGTVFHDANQSMRYEPGEVQLDSRLAYIDSNDNARLDDGERYAVTDAEGRFEFRDLDTGIHPVRLFDGAASQAQTFPVDAEQSPLTSDFQHATDAAGSATALSVLTADTLVQVESSGTRLSRLTLPFAAEELVTTVTGEAGAAALISGRFVGEDQTQQSGLWLAPADSDEVRLLHHQAADGSAPRREIVFGADGHGVILTGQEDAASLQPVRLITAESAEGGASTIQLEVTAAPIEVPSATRLIGAADAVSLGAEAFGSRSVLAWPDSVAASVDDPGTPAMRASLWSNSAGDWVRGSETVIDGATELLAFDDRSGLLAVRYQQGDVGVLDVDANFAPLHRFDQVGEVVRFLPDHEALASLVATAQADTRLVLHDLRSGQKLADQAIATDRLGTPIALLPGGGLDQFFVVGESGIARLAMTQAAAHEISIEAADQSVDIQFAATVEGENTPPVAVASSRLATAEDETLTVDASEIASMVIDADRDRLISLLVDPPEHGSVQIRDDGGVDYQPQPDFNGEDRFAIRFHDGIAFSQPIQFSVSIAARPDLPSGIVFRGSGIPEHTRGPYTVGSIDIQDPDQGDSYELEVFDPRFGIEDGQLIFRSGVLDYEMEPLVQLSIFGFDSQASDYFSHDIVVHVEDENDPIAEVWHTAAEVYENVPRAFVAEIAAFDQDQQHGQEITFSVDDDRFEVIEHEVYLRPDQSIDFEAEPVVNLIVTADDGAGSTRQLEVEVTIFDVPEPVSQLTLSNQSVLELRAGAAVGDVLVNGFATAGGYQLSVDDARFEIDGSRLKLRDDQWVRQAAADQIGLTITAQDTSQSFEAVSRSFMIEVLENQTPYHNPTDPYDVNGTGGITPLDALVVINYLNFYGPGPVGHGNTTYGYDVNADGFVTALDALLVINQVNQAPVGGAVGGEPEEADGGEEDPSGVAVSGDETDTIPVPPEEPQTWLPPPPTGMPPADEEPEPPPAPQNDPPLTHRTGSRTSPSPIESESLVADQSTEGAEQDESATETDLAITDTLDFLDESDG